MSGVDGVRDVGGVYGALADGRYRAYPGYKDSGVEWLGEVPAHWKFKRLKFETRLINEKVEPNNKSEGPYVGMEHIASWTGKCVSFDGKFLPEGISNTFCSGDLLFGKLRPYLAKAFAAEFDGLCSSELMVLRPYEMVQRFLLYVLLSDGFIKLVDASTYGAKMPRANWEFIGSVRIPYPEIHEQIAISCFLDEQTQKIDDLIAVKRELLALLKEKRQAVITHAVTKGLDPNGKFKASGVDWLGDVPEHWDFKPLKYTSKLQTGLTLGKNYPQNDLVERPYLRVANVQSGRLELSEIKTVQLPRNEASRYRLREGDVLLTEGGDFDKLGRGHIWEGQIADCLHQNHIFAVRPVQNKLDSRFLAFVLMSHYGRDYFTATSQQTTNLATTNSTKLRAFTFAVPPVDEQKNIVTHLINETSKIDELSSEIETAITKLQEYRTALISAAVTGKIDVRGYAP